MVSRVCLTPEQAVQVGALAGRHFVVFLSKTLNETLFKHGHFISYLKKDKN